MAYIDIYNASVDPTFQARCLIAAREIARAITADETVLDNAGTNLNVVAGSENFAKSLLRNRQTISMEQIAILVLTNTTIAANPGASTDADILWQTKENWLIYVEIS
jgi:hypothetical protein